MDAARVAQAARLLVEARRTGKKISELPSECKPSNPTEANAIAAEVTRELGEPIAGWKITFLYKPREKPFIAALIKSRVLTSPADIPQSLTPSLCIEPEVTFRLLDDLPPRLKPYRPQEVADAIEACASLEVVDTRFDTSTRTIRQMLNERHSLIEAYADHITNGAFIIGAAKKDWQELDFAKMPVTMRSEKRVIVETTGGHAFVDPFLPVVVLANEMRNSDGLKKGQVVATGSFSGFFPVEVDELITANFPGVGQASARFVKG